MYALAAAPDGAIWAATDSSVVRFDGKHRITARIAFPGSARVVIDGLAVTPRAVWVSGWFGARFETARGVLLPSGPTTGFVGVWDPATQKLRWIRRIGSGGALARRLAVAADGSAWVVGATTGKLGLGPTQRAHGASDAFALHLSATGTVLHSLRFGTPGQDQARGVAVGKDGTVAIVGQYGGPTRRHPSGAVDPRMALTVGAMHLAHHGDDDGFVILIDSQGHVLGGSAIAAPGFDVVKDIRPVPGGWVAVGSMKRVGGAAGHIGGSAPLIGFVSWLDARGHVKRTVFPAGLLSVHALALYDGRLWASGHAGNGHMPRMAVLLRIGSNTLSEVARCQGSSGMTLGYGVGAGIKVWFGGIAGRPIRCTGAHPYVKGWALFVRDAKGD